LDAGKIELILKILRARTLQNKLNQLDQVRDVIRGGALQHPHRRSIHELGA
jgi:hypothetical protein